MSEELLKKWDITLMPMHILMGEDSYLDGVTVHPADVFAYAVSYTHLIMGSREPNDPTITSAKLAAQIPGSVLVASLQAAADWVKQKTAYEISECDWSSDVCSSDLPPAEGRCAHRVHPAHHRPAQGLSLIHISMKF